MSVSFNLENEPRINPRGYIGWKNFVGKLAHEPKLQTRNKAKGKGCGLNVSPFATPIGKQYKALERKRDQLVGEINSCKRKQQRKKKIEKLQTVIQRMVDLQTGTNL